MSEIASLQLLFLAMLALTTFMRVLLAVRQMRHVAAHRGAVPKEFRATIPLDAHQKAADYTITRTRLGLIHVIVSALLLLIFTLGGGLQLFFDLWENWFTLDSYAHGIALFGTVGLVYAAVDLPFSIYRTFVIEERFGFNKISWPLFVGDRVKGALLSILIGGPLLLALLWLMTSTGNWWWLYVWVFWLGFNLLVMLIYPTFIAPLFNKFTPLTDATLAARIDALLARCGFRSSGFFVMDGSRRSSHGNAYFTGFGAAKRIVFFDTLLNALKPVEIEAVLAHELGHYKLKHIWKRVAVSGIISLALIALLNHLLGQPWFYLGFGMNGYTPAAALLLFMLVLPVYTFPLSPLFSQLSRQHEFEADAYAARQAQAGDLISALVKLYRDNAATLTPDPLYSTFYDSHPPAALRIAKLQTA